MIDDYFMMLLLVMMMATLAIIMMVVLMMAMLIMMAMMMIMMLGDDDDGHSHWADNFKRIFLPLAGRGRGGGRGGMCVLSLCSSACGFHVSVVFAFSPALHGALTATLDARRGDGGVSRGVPAYGDPGYPV